ncbi:MAG TPA: hypothetical protein VKB20_01335, partial [Steroidobacteraceae bacterium]|nr:hypothetical protein [Steroidobacteraceae bacterium]
MRSTTILISAPPDSSLRSSAEVADLVVADRRIAGLSWSAYRSVLDALIARATLEAATRRPGQGHGTSAQGHRVV